MEITTPRGGVQASGDVTIRLDWSPGFAADWSGHFARVQKMFDLEVLRRMSPYVPVQTHTLEHSPIYASDIGSGLLVYATPYAAAQYYTTADTRPYDPLRGGHWADRMLADNGAALERFAQRAATGGAG